MTTDQMREIIEKVTGSPVRSSAYGMPGERKPMPYACVDDYKLQATIFISGVTEDAAVKMLFDNIAKRYPLQVEAQIERIEAAA